MKAIDTTYKGWRFRSRLEARWAVYFDAIGLKWEYEPQGFNLGDGHGAFLPYLPDFWLPQVRSWAEVKPVAFSKDEFRKAELLVEASGSDCLLLVGTPDARSYDVVTTHCHFSCPDDCTETTTISDLLIDSHYLREHRFYMSCGGDDPHDNAAGNDEIREAVEAARSARFEHRR